MDSAAIVLELDSTSITTGAFEAAVMSFFGIVRKVGREYVGKKASVRWLVSVESGSARLLARPEVSKDPSLASPMLSVIAGGLRSLEVSDERPDYFNDAALSFAKTLSGLTTREKDRVDHVRIIYNDRMTEVTKKTHSHVESITGIESKDYGTIEGRLSVISERDHLKCYVYQFHTNRRVECLINTGQLSEVIQGFQHRVSVSGRIHYQKHGIPASITVDQIKILPSKESLPGIYKVKGILKGSI